MLVAFQCPFVIVIMMTVYNVLLISNYFYTRQTSHGEFQRPSNKLQQLPVLSSFPLNNAPSKFDGTKDERAKNVVIIAINPDSKERLVALWSQLECFFGNKDKFDEVIVSAPLWAKEEGLIEPFLQHAKEILPNFRDGSISLSVQYYINDRYDVGLWCDALLNKSGESMDGINMHLPILDRTTGSFIIINDSIMAVEKGWTQVLDVLNDKQLNMTSLNFSLQGGYWLESAFRGFSKNGMRKFTDYACKEKTMVERCPMARTKPREYKRCVVETYEIHIGKKLFSRNEIRGIYPSDAPKETLVGAKNLDTNSIGRTTW